jgi:type IV pilus assembly protein PilW
MRNNPKKMAVLRRRFTRDLSSGFSLVELMIALTISLAIVAAVGYVYVGNQAAFRTQTADSRQTDNGRIAIEYITRDFRQAGKLGCTRPSRDDQHGALALTASLPVMVETLGELEPVLRPPDSPGVRLFEPGAFIRAFDNGIDFIEPKLEKKSTRRPSTDVLQIIKGGDTSSHLVRDMTDAKLDEPLLASKIFDIKSGASQQLFVISDCDRAEIVRASLNESVDAVGGKLNTNRPGWNQGDGLTRAYKADATVSRFDPVIYSIRDASSDAEVQTPRLVRHSLKRSDSDSGRWSDRFDIIADGIEDLQVRFGVATAGIDVNIPDRYMTPTEIKNSGNADELWAQVRSVEITLTVISERANVATTATNVVNGAGTDTRLRQRIVHVISLRNAVT